MKFYHGTSDDILDSIRTQGLIPKGSSGADYWASVNNPKMYQKMESHNRPPSVYFTPFKDIAVDYALLSSVVRKGRPVIIHLDIPDTEFERDICDSLGLRTTKVITADKITRVEYL